MIGGDKAVQTPLGRTGRCTIVFPADACPAKLVFVLKDGDKWSNGPGGSDFAAYLKPPGDAFLGLGF